MILIYPGLPSEIKAMLSMIYYFLPLLGIAVAINTIKLRGAIPVFCGIFLVVAVALEFFHVI
jgi:PTS system mannose-specific IIC component